MLGIILLQMDIIGAYLESFLSQNNELIYMKIFEKCRNGREELICKILKSLYSFKQVKKLWNKTIIKFFQKIRFVPINADPCILIYRQGDVFILVGVYIDNFMLRS